MSISRPLAMTFTMLLTSREAKTLHRFLFSWGRSGFIVFHRLIYKYFCAIEAVNIHEQVYFVALQILSTVCDLCKLLKTAMYLTLLIYSTWPPLAKVWQKFYSPLLCNFCSPVPQYLFIYLLWKSYTKYTV